MLFTSRAGQQKARISALSNDSHLGKGIFMDFRSSHSDKKYIDYPQNSVLSAETEWSFLDLYQDIMEQDFFERADSFEIHDYKDILSWCISQLEGSPSAHAMLKEVCSNGWSITLDDLDGNDYVIDVAQKVLTLDNNSLVPAALGRSNYFRNVTLVTLVKALRDIWQEKRHGGFDELYSPDYVLMMERVRAADLCVLAVVVGWELRAEEYPDLWRHIIGSEIGDMAMIYAKSLERDPISCFNGLALRVTFQNWYHDEARVNACDHDALEYMDDILASANMINPFGTKKPSKMNVEILSCLPDRSAYLQGQGTEILLDPIYSAVDSDINQSHLLHIMNDLDVVIVEDVSFRDADLARKIFPKE